MYTIGQTAKMFNLPISTLRYYDKEGLFPSMQRISGKRSFSETEIEGLRVIECLKKSGLEIKDIKKFMEWSAQGSSTFKERKALFEKQQAVVEQEMQSLEKVLSMIKYKCWYYDEAIKNGNEEVVLNMIPDQLPSNIQKNYDQAHAN